MQLREIANKSEWEDFLRNCPEKTFLQSWNWGDFNLQQGSKIWRFAAYENNRIVAVALVIKVAAKRGTFLFIPHGPIIEQGLNGKDKQEILKILISQLENIAKDEGASFIRISPLLEETEENAAIFLDLGFREAPMHASAYEATWKLDIFPPEDELLKNMRKTTRYLIKKAQENSEVSIVTSKNPEDLKIYQQLNREVAKRQKFVGFSDKFIENEFNAFAKDNEVLLVFGKAGQEIAAGAMVIFWPASPAGGSGMAFYHQAASLGKFAKLSIPYLLQWEAIKEAKKRGCVVYDFWGFTDPEKYPKHPWAGPTLFKMGFGGYKKEYIKTQDYIISQKYWINYIIEKIRKFWRGL